MADTNVINMHTHILSAFQPFSISAFQGIRHQSYLQLKILMYVRT